MSTNRALSTGFFLLLTLGFPTVSILLTNWMVGEKATDAASASIQSW